MWLEFSTHLGLVLSLASKVLALNKTDWIYPSSNLTIHYGDTIICDWNSTYTINPLDVNLRLNLFCSSQPHGSPLLPWAKQVSTTGTEPVIFSDMSFVGWTFPFICSFTISPADDYLDPKRGNSSTQFVLDDSIPGQKAKTWSASSTSAAKPTSTTPSVATTPSSITTSTMPSSTPTTTPAADLNAHDHSGLIAGVVVVVVVVIAVTVCAIFGTRRRRQRRHAQSETHPSDVNQQTSTTARLVGGLFRRDKKHKDQKDKDLSRVEAGSAPLAELTDGDIGTRHEIGNCQTVHELPGPWSPNELDGRLALREKDHHDITRDAHRQEQVILQKP